MAKRSFQAPTGTRDLYPEDAARRRYLTEAWRDISLIHGFDEIAGPTFEHLELYTVKSGEGIVSELFSFRRAGGETDYALRPEFTPTLARMFAARAGALAAADEVVHRRPLLPGRAPPARPPARVPAVERRHPRRRRGRTATLRRRDHRGLHRPARRARPPLHRHHRAHQRPLAGDPDACANSVSSTRTSKPPWACSTAATACRRRSSPRGPAPSTSTPPASPPR
jgi:hypothetical protein